MAFIKGHEFVFENKQGVIFNFYLNEQKHIEYIVSNKKGRWREKGLVFNQSTVSLHLDVDVNDNIHAISYSENGSLYYHQYINEAWVNHLILHYPVAEQRIVYPIIKYINDQIHIFYYLLHNKLKNKAHLLHLKFHNNKHSTNHIVTVDSNAYINPFKIFVDDNEILLLYASVVKGYEQILISRFNISTEKWSDTTYLTSSTDKKIYIDGLLDNDKILHLIWSGFDEEYLTVQYLKLDKDKLIKDKLIVDELKPILLSSKSSCSFPILIYYENILWAIWTEMGKLISCYSIDTGENWSQPYIHEDTKHLDFRRYRYISASTNNKSNILCDFVFGTLYPNIQFLGLGGEVNDEIPSK